MKLGEKDNCQYCGKEFIRHHSQQRFCSPECRFAQRKIEEKRLRELMRPPEGDRNFHWHYYEKEAKKAPCGRYETCFVCEEEDCIWNEGTHD